MTDLPKDLRGQLATLALDRAIEIAEERRSSDDTRKLLVRLGTARRSRRWLIPGVTGGKERSALAGARPRDGRDAAAAVR